MAAPSRPALRAFVRRYTRLVDVPDLPGVRLHLADDVTVLAGLAGRELRETDPALPYWGFAWAGGLAIVRYLAEHPDEVAGRRVVDVASGSGLCAIAAVRAGAQSVVAFDVDPLAEAAVAVNARANGVRIGFSRRDAGDAALPPCDVILAGDIAYEEDPANRVFGRLRAAALGGVRVLIGDPGRTYLPTDLERLATYRVRTSLELENAAIKESAVFTFPRPTGSTVGGE